MTNATTNPQLNAAPNKPEAVFVCSYCGATRSSKLLCGSATLKCAGCGLTTKHDIAGVRDGAKLLPARGADWQEDSNAEQQAQIRTVQWLESVYAHLGIQIDDSVDLHSRGVRRLFALNHEVRDGQHVWQLDISSEASSSGRLFALRTALGCLVDGGSSGKSWMDNPNPNRWSWGGTATCFVENVVR